MDPLDTAPQTLVPRSPLQLIDQAIERLRAAPGVAVAGTAVTAVPLAAIGLVWVDVTAVDVTQYVHDNQAILQQLLCLGAALILPLRHLMQELAIRAAYPEEVASELRILPSLATGALKSLALAFATLFMLLPALFGAIRWQMSAALSACEGLYTEKALQRSWRLSEASKAIGWQLFVALFVLYALVILNLWLALPWLLWLFEFVGGLDLTPVQAALDITQPTYQGLLLVLGWILLDPLLALIGVELYRDTLVREEGLDLQRRLDTLEQTLEDLDEDDPRPDWRSDDAAAA